MLCENSGLLLLKSYKIPSLALLDTNRSHKTRWGTPGAPGGLCQVSAAEGLFINNSTFCFFTVMYMCKQN